MSAESAGVPPSAPVNAGCVMSTPVSMTATTLPSPFWVIWSACIISCALRFAGSWVEMREEFVAPSPATWSSASSTWVSRSRNAALTPLTARMASSEPAGALSAKPCTALSYSRSTWAEEPGNAPATASLIEARAAARSAPSSSWTMMLTTEAGSTSSVVGADASWVVCPLFEVSAVLTSPTGRDEAVAPASGWVSAPVGGDARVAGPATTSAAVPASARSVAGFFVVMCVTPMC